MRRGLPIKDGPYDASPYEAAAQAQRDVAERVVSLMTSVRIRPGLMATRLNRAGITAPDGGVWDWLKVRDHIDRAVTAGEGTCGVFFIHPSASRW
jgi:hypothetical protein